MDWWVFLVATWSESVLCSYFQQKLGDLEVAVGAGVVERNQAAAGKQDSQVNVTVLADDRWRFRGLFWKSLTLCPWRERQLRAGGGAARCGPGCSRQPGAVVWTVREESLLADSRLDGLLWTASDGHESKRLIRARSCVLRQARLCELQMNGRYDDDAKSIRVCGQIQRQNSFCPCCFCLTWVSNNKRPRYSSNSTSSWQGQQNKRFLSV